LQGTTIDLPPEFCLILTVGCLDLALFSNFTE